MKNIYKLNEFLKIKNSTKVNEADRFAGDVSFSESLVGRLFNNIFGFFRKNIYTGLLIMYKRKLEDVYLQGVIKTLAESNVSKESVSQNSEEALKEAEAQDNETLENPEVNVENPEEEPAQAQTQVPVQAQQVTGGTQAPIQAPAQQNPAQTPATSAPEAQVGDLIDFEIRKVEFYPEAKKIIDEYDPEKAKIQRYTTLKMAIEYLYDELKSIQTQFLNVVGIPTNFAVTNIPKTEERMKMALNSEGATFKKYVKDPKNKQKVTDGMGQSIEEWMMVAGYINDGNKKLAVSDQKNPKLKDLFDRIYKKAYSEAVKKYENKNTELLNRLFEAQEAQKTSLEEAQKNDQTLGQKFPKEKLGEYENMKTSELNGEKVKEQFKNNPEMVTTATNAVNVEKVKDIQLSAEMLYYRDKDANIGENKGGLLTKNFRAGDKEKIALEYKWKKLVAKVKAGFQGILDTDKLDPIVLVNNDTNLRNKALSGEMVPKQLTAGSQKVAAYLTTESVEKLELAEIFPTEDYWWMILTYTEGIKTYGILAMKFNVPVAQRNPVGAAYKGMHFSFIIDKIYDWDSMIASDSDIESLQDFEQFVLKPTDAKPVFDKLFNNVSITNGGPFYVKRLPDNSKPTRTGVNYDYDVWNYTKGGTPKFMKSIKLNLVMYKIMESLPMKKYKTTIAQTDVINLANGFAANPTIQTNYPKGRESIIPLKK